MDVEFIERSRPGRWHWMLLLLVGCLAVSMWAFVWWSERDVVQRQRLLQDARQRMAQERILASIAAVPVRAPYAEDAWHAWRLGQFKTIGALRALEGVSEVGISLSSIDIDAERGDVVIKFKAATSDAMVHFLKSLNAKSQGASWRISQIVSSNGAVAVPSTAYLDVTASSHWESGTQER